MPGLFRHFLLKLGLQFVNYFRLFLKVSSCAPYKFIQILSRSDSNMRICSWGSNSHGQLGQGIQIEQLLIPTRLNFTLKAKVITGGGKHSVILTVNNEVFTCGDNSKGQLGNNDLPTTSLYRFQPIFSCHKVLFISCGWDFNLALTDKQKVLGWGSNFYGQLGIPVEKCLVLHNPTVIFEKEAVSISAGLRHSAIVTTDGSVFTSGYGRKGQLGFDVSDSGVCKVDRFTKVRSIENCEEVSCGECHSIVKLKGNLFYSWGNNKFGQLGLNPETTISCEVPLKINVSVNGKISCHIYSGWAHNCILTGDGELLTWGRNDLGQLGQRNPQNWKPAVVSNLKKVKQISLGSHHCVALTDCNEVISWGWNEHGNCGNERSDNVQIPTQITNNVQLIGSGAAHSFCVYQD